MSLGHFHDFNYTLIQLSSLLNFEQISRKMLVCLRSDYNTNSALINILNYLSFNTGQNKPLAQVFQDLIRSFNTVDQTILQGSLGEFRLSGTALKCFTHTSATESCLSIHNLFIKILAQEIWRSKRLNIRFCSNLNFSFFRDRNLTAQLQMSQIR